MRLLPKNSDHNWTAFIWLIYLSFFAAAPALSRGTTRADWAATAVGLVLFLALYFRAYWVTGRALLLCIAGIVILGVVYAPFNPGAGSFFIFAAAFAGSVGTSRDAVRILLVIELVTCATMWLARVSIYNAVWPIVFVLVVGAVNTHYAQVGRANKRLRLAHDEIERLAKVAERERIARDLHDLLGHTLSLVILKSELASKLAVREPERAAQEIADVERIARDALTQVRQAVRGYRSQGLQSEIASAAEMLAAANVEFDANVPMLSLAASHEAILSLALREAVTNVVRHAGATRCSLTVETRGGGVRMVVADDGRGGSARDGAGLSGMRERIASLGGTMTREGSKGTVLTIDLPTPQGMMEQSA